MEIIEDVYICTEGQMLFGDLTIEGDKIAAIEP